MTANIPALTVDQVLAVLVAISGLGVLGLELLQIIIEDIFEGLNRQKPELSRLKTAKKLLILGAAVFTGLVAIF